MVAAVVLVCGSFFSSCIGQSSPYRPTLWFSGQWHCSHLLKDIKNPIRHLIVTKMSRIIRHLLMV